MDTEMVARLKATHTLPGKTHWVEVASNIGWIPCPLCKLPFKPGGKLLYDNVTHNGVCEDCGERGLKELQGETIESELDLPY